MTYEQALKWAGGTQVKLAEKLGIWQGSIANWGGVLPAARQLQIEKLSKGRLKADTECWEPKRKVKQ